MTDGRTARASLGVRLRELPEQEGPGLDDHAMAGEAERGRGLLLIDALATCWGDPGRGGLPLLRGAGHRGLGRVHPPRPGRGRRPNRPRSHRRPRHRRRTAWRLTAYTLAALAGALAHHLAAPLL
ncbi:hypothetical protein SUDANB121_00995 [Nocardiopsis dassonvillei]